VINYEESRSGGISYYKPHYWPTRQDIQIHYVDLNRTPEFHVRTEKLGCYHIREACGNTVRNATASETVYIDGMNLLITYAQALFGVF
jgi:sulfite reductase (ferredoxin)